MDEEEFSGRETWQTMLPVLLKSIEGTQRFIAEMMQEWASDREATEHINLLFGGRLNRLQWLLPLVTEMAQRPEVSSYRPLLSIEFIHLHDENDSDEFANIFPIAENKFRLERVKRIGQLADFKWRIHFVCEGNVLQVADCIEHIVARRQRRKHGSVNRG